MLTFYSGKLLNTNNNYDNKEGGNEIHKHKNIKLYFQANSNEQIKCEIHFTCEKWAQVIFRYVRMCVMCVCVYIYSIMK